MTDEQWHLDKRVTMAVIGILVTQTVTLIGWGAGLERRIAVMETQILQTVADNQRQDVLTTDAVRLLREEIRDLKGDIRSLGNQLLAHNGQARKDR